MISCENSKQKETWVIPTPALSRLRSKSAENTAFLEVGVGITFSLLNLFTYPISEKSG